MTIVIPCSTFSCLAGINIYTTPYKAILSFIRNNGRRPYIRKNIKKIQEILKHEEFYKKYICSTTITNILKFYARDKIIKICRQHGINSGMPFGFYSKARGIHLEKLGMKLYSRMTGKPITEKYIKVSKNFGIFELRGEIDCILDKTIIEIKIRQGHFIVPPPNHDLMQLSLYCIIRETNGVLVQFGNELEFHETKLSFQEATCFFNKHFDKAQFNISYIDKCLKNPRKQNELMLERTNSIYRKRTH